MSKLTDNKSDIVPSIVFEFPPRNKLESKVTLFGKRSNINVETEEKPCRICLISFSTEKNNLVRPCKCSGSIKYIHEECLKTWIVSQEKMLDNNQCNICHTKYQMTYNLKRRCRVIEAIRTKFVKCLFIPIIIAVMIILLLISFLLAQNFFLSSNNSQYQVSAAALAITCTLSGITLIFVSINAIRQTCYTERIEDWRIFSINVSEEEKKDLSEVDSDIIFEMRKQPLMIPKMFKVHGRQIRSPLLRPSLTPIIKSGKVVGFNPAFLVPSEAVRSHDESCTEFSPMRDRVENSLISQADFSIRDDSKQNTLFDAQCSSILEDSRNNSAVGLLKISEFPPIQKRGVESQFYFPDSSVLEESKDDPFSDYQDLPRIATEIENPECSLDEEEDTSSKHNINSNSQDFLIRRDPKINTLFVRRDSPVENHVRANSGDNLLKE